MSLIILSEDKSSDNLHEIFNFVSLNFRVKVSKLPFTSHSLYYDNNGEYIYRPESLDKVYGSLMRYVKKLAPYSEISTLRSDNESKYTRKEYVTPYCLELIKNSNYR